MFEAMENTGGGPLILHPVGLPSLSAGLPSAAYGIARLREILARPTVQLWNGGYAGAPGVHLTAEEVAWDLTWARTNPWDSGYGRCLGVAPTVDFPVLLTATQAPILGEDRPAEGQLADGHPADPAPLCVGYVGYTRAAPATGGHRLWFREHDRWKWLASRIVVVPGQSDPPLGDGEDPDECLHIVLTQPEAVVPPDLCLPTAERLPELHHASESPQGTFFHSGIERGAGGLAPERAAVVAAIRESRAVSRDRTVRILRAAAEMATPPTGSDAAARGHDPFENRELQGGVTGSLRLDTDSVGAVFSAGRIAGFVYDGAPVTPAVRSQGFLQTVATTRHLTSISAAWFTGLRVRGVHEVAEIPKHLRLGVTTFAMEGLPGLVLNITGENPNTASPGAEEAVVRQGALEIPLWDLNDPSTKRTGAVLDSSGQVREITVFPHLTEGLTDSDSPLEWSVAAVGLRVDLPAASLWIISAHPGATLSVPFTLGARPIAAGYRVSWYPAGFERSTVPADSLCSRWSVSYRILAADQNAAVPVISRVEHDLKGEIDGFSCQGVFARRSVPEK